MDRDHRPVDDPGIQPDPGACPEGGELGPRRGHVDAVHQTGLRLPVLGGILGVQPGFDGIALGDRRFSVQPAAVGDVDLQLDKVESGGLLGDRVLDL